MFDLPRFSCSQPVNEFPLSDKAEEYTLIAGGVCITSILAMTHAPRSKGPDFQLGEFRGSV